jgi:hypothetical protein
MAIEYMKKCSISLSTKNYIEVPLHPGQNGYYQENKQEQILVEIWGERNPCTLLVGM